MAGCAVYAEAPLAYQAAGDEAWDHALGFGKRYATPQLHDPCGAAAVHSPVCWCWCSTTIQNQRQWWNSDSCGGFSDSVAYMRKLCQEHGTPKTSCEATHCNCNTCNSAFWRQVALMALLHSVRELPLQPCYCHGNSLKVTCCVLGYGGSPPTHLARARGLFRHHEVSMGHPDRWRPARVSTAGARAATKPHSCPHTSCPHLH